LQLLDACRLAAATPCTVVSRRLLPGPRRAQKLLSSTLKTNISARFPLAEAQKGVETYQVEMTGGKLLIVPV
jgi:hypothetical protein